MSQVMTFAEHYLETLALRIDVMAAQVSNFLPLLLPLLYISLSLSFTFSSHISFVQVHCPLDVKEQVCGIIYIAPFVEKSTEMIQVNIRRRRRGKRGNNVGRICCVIL